MSMNVAPISWAIPWEVPENYYLGSKHGNVWAALAPIAPAAMGMTNDRTKVLQAIKDAGVPMLVSMGDADEAVPVANVRTWVDTMKELQMDVEYKEYPGVTHGPIMAASMDSIYALREALETGVTLTRCR